MRVEDVLIKLMAKHSGEYLGHVEIFHGPSLVLLYSRWSSALWCMLAESRAGVKRMELKMVYSAMERER